MFECTVSLEQSLRQQGYVEGAPPQVPPAIVAVDQRIYSRQHCESCRHRGQRVQPFHKGRVYRLVCSCTNPACGRQVEG